MCPSDRIGCRSTWTTPSMTERSWSALPELPLGRAQRERGTVRKIQAVAKVRMCGGWGGKSLESTGEIASLKLQQQSPPANPQQRRGAASSRAQLEMASNGNRNGSWKLRGLSGCHGKQGHPNSCCFSARKTHALQSVTCTNLQNGVAGLRMCK